MLTSSYYELILQVYLTAMNVPTNSYKNPKAQPIKPRYDYTQYTSNISAKA